MTRDSPAFGTWSSIPKGFEGSHSHCYLSQLLFGEVEWVVVGRYAIAASLSSSWKAGAEKPIVHNVHKGHHGVPALVVEPHLDEGNNMFTVSAKNRQGSL